MTSAPQLQRAIVPVIMSGGSGTRLWPLSTEETPKQFHALASHLTMIQETVLRFRDDPHTRFEAPIIICNARHHTLARKQLAEIGVIPSAIVLEPFGRNTAAVAVVAARMVKQLNPGALVLLAPADHVIPQDDVFRAAIARGARFPDRIVTFGVQPTGPETGYGYIQAGTALDEGVFEVARFVEKPAREIAEDYLRQGGYAWNAGIFLFDPDVMLGEMATFRPDILAAVDAALGERVESPEAGQGLAFTLPGALFARTPSESIDVAVMERTGKAAVAPFDAGWADLGAWNEIWRLAKRDGADNLVRGEAVTLDTTGSLVWAEGMVVATLGVQDLIVVATGGTVVILPKSRAQDVKRVVEAVRARQTASAPP
jgi:mannose-1-phosphate guanylyltransferase/mannose-6-phosphate isomerase